MRILGASARVADGRYLVGFAVIEEANVLFELSLAAPPDESEAARLGELWGRTVDLVKTHEPQRFALLVGDLDRSPSSATVARRAEGVILGAVGRSRAIDVSYWRGRGLAKPAGLTGRVKNVEAVNALCAGLEVEPSTDEVRYAAAAAVAAS